MKTIITIPHQTLREVAKEVKVVDKKLVNFIADLENTLNYKSDPAGVGLASPQIDKSLRIFSLKINNLETFINPIIVKESDKLSFGPDENEPIMEACLSIPKLYGPVPRHTWIEVEYQIIENNKLVNKKTRLEDFPARVFQHELDHLDGILFTDYALKYDLPIYRELKRNKYEEVDRSLLKLF